MDTLNSSSPSPTVGHRQSEPTALVWGCGHTDRVHLALGAELAAEQIAAYTQIDCIHCAKAKKAQTHGICWADVNR